MKTPTNDKVLSKNKKNQPDVHAHIFKDYILDPVPKELWRNAKPIENTKVGFCDSCQFYHVTPYPAEDYLKAFYKNYEMPTSQQNLSETARLLAQYVNKSAKIVDLGCGDGEFLKNLHQLGFKKLFGLDQSPGVERAKKLDFGTFQSQSLWEYIEGLESAGSTSDSDVMVMINVLEHVAEPLNLLKRVHQILPKDGVLCVTVPNDFSPLQRAFLKVKGHLPWFVCLPDHLNYFSFETLNLALEKTGFKVLGQSGLYPLELFLLQDLDYVAHPELGPVAHKRRVEFEENLKKAGMTDVLDHFYRTLAAGGYGRDVMVVAKKIG